MTPSAELSVKRRVAIALAMALLTAVYMVWFAYDTKQTGRGGSDFDQLWFAARAMLQGRDPYALIGPGKEFEWIWPFAYPLSTVVAVVPLAPLPVLAARVIFASVSAGLFTYAISSRGPSMLPVLGSVAAIDAIRAAQLSPLMTAGLLLTAASPALVLKPHTGLALLAASPRPRSVVIAGVAGALLLAIAFAAQPAWLLHWREAVQHLTHLRAPILAFGGPVLLLALLRWRRFDARVLLACALVPHTPSLYDVLPLVLVARNLRESLAFSLLTYVALYAQLTWLPPLSPAERPASAAMILNVCLYLPAVAAILARPNESEGEAADGALARWTRRRRAAAAPSPA